MFLIIKHTTNTKLENKISWSVDNKQYPKIYIPKTKLKNCNLIEWKELKETVKLLQLSNSETTGKLNTITSIWPNIIGY